MTSPNSTPAPKVAVIILNWNGAALLREYLPAVLANTSGTLGRVIVADNGSTDSSQEVLRTEFPEVETLIFDRNYGFAEGYNKAVSHYRHYPYAVLLNSDVAPDPGWLEPLYEFMESHPRCAACQPKLLSRAEPDKFEYAGAAGGFIDRNGYPYCRGRIFATCETDNGQYDSPMEVDWASGAAMMTRTAAYLECGGLDPSFFAHMEEIDLCWRMRLAGYTVWAVPGSTVHHLGGGSLPPSNPRKTFLNFRNNLLMLYKNLPEKTRDRSIRRRMLLDAIAWAKFAATFSWGNAAAIVRAHNDFRRMRGQMKTAGADADLQAGRPNILVEYYLRRNSAFSAIPGNGKK